jgi:hypothetical protein
VHVRRVADDFERGQSRNGLHPPHRLDAAHDACTGLRCDVLPGDGFSQCCRRQRPSALVSAFRLTLVRLFSSCFRREHLPLDQVRHHALDEAREALFGPVVGVEGRIEQVEHAPLGVGEARGDDGEDVRPERLAVGQL